MEHGKRIFIVSKNGSCAAEDDDFAYNYSQKGDVAVGLSQSQPSANPLYEYFKANQKGLGIWKWEHYFEIYHRHLSRFIGKSVGLVEIGVYSGGSLGMWLDYFGPKCHVYGIDIEDACRVYAADNISIFIGDQENRGFWKSFKEQVSSFDIIIDDGGHEPQQQLVTLQELLPSLNPGGVYICEDIHGRENEFAVYVASLLKELNAVVETSAERMASAFQSLFSLHFYPYLLVIEKRTAPLHKLRAPKHGSQWQPFFDISWRQKGQGGLR